MQEIQSPGGQPVRELFAAQTREQMVAGMDARRAELESKGYKFLRRVKVGRNDPCPCGSGKKFKKCHIEHLWGAMRDQYARLSL